MLVSPQHLATCKCKNSAADFPRLFLSWLMYWCGFSAPMCGLATYWIGILSEAVTKSVCSLFSSSYYSIMLDLNSMWLLSVFDGDSVFLLRSHVSLFNITPGLTYLQEWSSINFISPACIMPKGFDDSLQIDIKCLQKRFATIGDSMVCGKRNKRELSSDNTLSDCWSKQKKEWKEYKWIWIMTHTWSTLISQMKDFSTACQSLVSVKATMSMYVRVLVLGMTSVTTIPIHKHHCWW